MRKRPLSERLAAVSQRLAARPRLVFEKKTLSQHVAIRGIAQLNGQESMGTMESDDDERRIDALVHDSDSDNEDAGIFSSSDPYYGRELTIYKFRANTDEPWAPYQPPSSTAASSRKRRRPDEGIVLADTWLERYFRAGLSLVEGATATAASVRDTSAV